MRPRPKYRLAVALVGLVALLGTVWFLAVRQRNGDHADPDSDNESASAAPSEAPLLAGHRPDRTAAASPNDSWRQTIVEPKGPVSIAPGPQALVGTVVDVNGRPAAGKVVSADIGWLRAEDIPLDVPLNIDWWPHRTDARGHFRFEPMPSTGARLNVVGDPDWVGEPVAARPGAPVTIKLRPRPWVTITVMDATQRPIAGAIVVTWVSLVEPDADAARALDVSPSDLARVQHVFADGPIVGRSSFSQGVTDAAGHVRIAPILREHPCLLRVGATRTTPRGAVAEGELFPRDIDPWTPKDETIVLRRARSLTGVVRDLRGEIVTEGTVDWEGVEGSSGTTRVEYDGTFEIDRAPDGPVTLEFKMGGTPLPPNAGRRTAAAGDTDVRLAVDFGSDLDVRVEGWPRSPGGIVHVTREIAEGAGPTERASASIDPDGRARIRGLRADVAYTAWIAPTIEDLQGEGTWRHARREHVRVTDSPITLTLADGTAIEGHIPPSTVREGLWASGSAIVDERGVVLRAPIDAQGRFVLRGLPAGSWTVRIFATTSPWYEGPDAVVFEGTSVEKTGTTDAVITVGRAPEGTPLLPPSLR
jgi:hypothetical protein